MLSSYHVPGANLSVLFKIYYMCHMEFFGSLKLGKGSVMFYLENVLIILLLGSFGRDWTL